MANPHKFVTQIRNSSRFVQHLILYLKMYYSISCQNRTEDFGKNINLYLKNKQTREEDK